MKKYILFIFSLVALLAVSCARDKVETPLVKEGEAQLRITCQMPEMNFEQTRGLTEREEKTIDRICVLLFRDKKLILKSKYEDLDGDSPIIDCYATATNSGIKFYLVANYDSELELALDALEVNASTEDDIAGLKVKSVQQYMETPKDNLLLMYGQTENLVVEAGKINFIQVPLSYVYSCVTVTVEDHTSNQNISFLDWRVVDAAKYTYLFPSSTGRDVMSGGDNGAFANFEYKIYSSANPQNPSNTTIQSPTGCFFTSKEAPFDASYYETIFVSSTEPHANHTYVSETLYLAENLRGNNMNCDSYGYRSGFMPARTTCFQTRLMIKESDKSTREVTMNLPLGGLNTNLTNDFTDYNLRRGVHYKYTVSINNDWSVDYALSTDTNVEAELTHKFPISIKGSSSLNFDSHPDERILVFEGAVGNIHEMEVEIVDANGKSYKDAGFDATWLKLSRYNALLPQISQNSEGGNLWMQQAPTENAAGYYVRGKYVPHKSRREWLENGSAAAASWFSYDACTYNATGGFKVETQYFGKLSTDQAATDPVYPVISPNGTESSVSYTSPNKAYTLPGGGVFTSDAALTTTESTTANGVQIPTYTNVFPDNDNVLPCWLASYRMCYKITNFFDNAIRTGSLTNTQPGDLKQTPICLYADENESDKPRYAKIRVTTHTITSSGTSDRTIDIPVSQGVRIAVGSVEGLTTKVHDLAIESLEEVSMALHTYSATESNFFNLQSTECMQWGHYGTRLSSNVSDDLRYDSGYFMTLKAVYKDVTDNGDICSYTPSNYQDKYGSLLFSPAGENGKLTEPTSNNTTTTTAKQRTYNNGTYHMYYYSDIRNTATFDTYPFHPVYNSSAARYCHEKNRDLDGDGNISDWETQWYLPSQRELYQIWVNFEAIQNASVQFGSGWYWSSTEIDENSAGSMGFTTGYGKAYDKRYPTSRSTTDYAKSNGAVRCVRKVTVSHPRAVNVVGDHYEIDCSYMPVATSTTVSKGSAATGFIDGTNLSDRKISTKAATVFKHFRIANYNCNADGTPLKDHTHAVMNWNVAVGYKNPYSLGDLTDPDPRINYSGNKSLKGKYPNANYMYGLRADANTGCAAYYEELDKSDKGKWRLPNKRELLLMYIYNSQLVQTDNVDFTPLISTGYSSQYWSATERTSSSASTVKFLNGECINPGKSETARARCIREIYSSLQYKLYLNPNGESGNVVRILVYGDTAFKFADYITNIQTNSLAVKNASSQSSTFSSSNGKVFGGWKYVDEDGKEHIFTYSGGQYTSVDTNTVVEGFTMPPYTVTLYAIWNTPTSGE